MKKHVFIETIFFQVALVEQQIMLPIKGMNMWISIATSTCRGRRGSGGIEKCLCGLRTRSAGTRSAGRACTGGTRT